MCDFFTFSVFSFIHKNSLSSFAKWNKTELSGSDESINVTCGEQADTNTWIWQCYVLWQCINSQKQTVDPFLMSSFPCKYVLHLKSQQKDSSVLFCYIITLSAERWKRKHIDLTAQKGNKAVEQQIALLTVSYCTKANPCIMIDVLLPGLAL